MLFILEKSRTDIYYRDGLTTTIYQSLFLSIYVHHSDPSDMITKEKEQICLQVVFPSKEAGRKLLMYSVILSLNIYYTFKILVKY